MYKVEQLDEDKMIVALAKKCDCLAEACNLIEYHPMHGKIEPYWQPKWFVKQMILASM